MKKGIIIYAIGHPNYYYMAENLAASLVVNGSSKAVISIGLICDSKAKIRYPHLFNDIMLIEREKFMVDDKVVFNNATVLVYDLSPYDITMKLDADMIWLSDRPVINLFNELKDVAITFSNRGCGWNKGNSEWAPEHEIRKAYKLSDEHKLYKICGEFVYFKKSEPVQEYFDKVKEVYKDPKVFCHDFANGNMTDELAFQIACMLTDVYPHEEDFTPAFNQFLGYKEYNSWYPYQLPKNFYGYSIGGNITNSWVKKGYDTLAKHYFSSLGLTMPYMATSKTKFLPERQKR